MSNINTGKNVAVQLKVVMQDQLGVYDFSASIASHRPFHTRCCVFCWLLCGDAAGFLSVYFLRLGPRPTLLSYT